MKIIKSKVLFFVSFLVFAVLFIGSNSSATEASATPATLHATKIICDSESDLPNWGGHSVSIINSSTATNFINSHPNCHIDTGWQFEWSTNTTVHPDDNITTASGYTAFSGSTTIPANKGIFVREQADSDYIPFKGENGSNVSAEFYCNNDIAGYDNLEWLASSAGAHYYCVGFNVHKAPVTSTINATKIVCDSESDLPNWGDHSLSAISASTATDFLASHPNCHEDTDWTFEWSTNTVDHPDDNITTASGYTPFSVSTIIPSGQSVFVREQASSDYIPFTGENGSNVSAEFYCGNDVAGYDNLEWIGYPTGGSNYYCVGFNVPKPFIRSAEITSPSEGEDVSSTVSFTATLTDKDNDDAVQWAVRKGTCAAGTNTVFGNVDGHSDTFTWDHTNFSASTDVSSWEPGLYCFIFNPTESVGDAPIRLTREFNVVEKTINEEKVVKQADLATSFSDVLSDPSKWFFYNDENDTIDGSLGSFVDGPDTAPLGDGSAQITVSGTQRRNLATYQFSGVKLADITSLTFSTYSQLAGDGANGLSGRSPYLNFNVDFNGSDTWQKRLIFVPRQNGTVTADTWQTWDAIDGGNALWAYSGSLWPGTADAGSTLKTWSDILALYPNIAVRTTDSWFGLRVGEPYSNGFTGNIDNIVLGVKSGLITTVKTFDFEPTQAE